jgi:hypothetical protein
MIRRRTPLKRGGRIASRSPERQAEEDKYRAAREAHFAEHPYCQYPGANCQRNIFTSSMDLHHAAGRNGPLLYCRKYFRTACRLHHDLAKSQISESRRIGWVIDVPTEEVRAMRAAEF